MTNNFTSQAGQMEVSSTYSTSNTLTSSTLSKLSGVPNDMAQAIGSIACIVLGPIIQTAYVILARYRIIPSSTPLITLAFGICGLTLGYSSGAQHLVYVSPPRFNKPLACLGGGVPNRVSVWLQVPMCFIAVDSTQHTQFGGIANVDLCRLSWRSSASLQFLLHAPQKKSRLLYKQYLNSLVLSAACLGWPSARWRKTQSRWPTYTSLAGVMVVCAAAYCWFFRNVDD